MDKQFALMFILLMQPVFAFLVWFSMGKLFGWLGLTGNTKTVVVLIATFILYAIFCFFFARGFLASSEAKKLGF